MRRIKALFSFRCYERRVLLNLAALRNTLVVNGALAMLAGHGVTIPGWAYLLGPCYGVLAALISADWIEHYARLLILGYATNIRVSARGELEGWNGPTHEEQEAEWRRLLRWPIFPDDPGPGVYPAPIPTFWGRVRAIWEGE